MLCVYQNKKQRKNNEFVLFIWKAFVFEIHPKVFVINYIYKWMYLYMTKRKVFVFNYISKYLTPYLDNDRIYPTSIQSWLIT